MNPVLHTWWFSALVVSVCAMLAVAGLLIVRRFVDSKALEIHHDVAGSIICIVGTLYAVVLGFIVVGALDTFQDARMTVEREANALHDIFHLSAGLPDPTGHKLRLMCLSYAQEVTGHEWATMEYGNYYPPVHHLMGDMWNAIVHYQPKAADDSDMQVSILSKMSELGDNRQMRLINAKVSTHPVVWGVLFFGGTVLVVFTYFFWVESLAVQMTMTLLLMLVLGLNLVVISMWGTPYTGDIKMSADALLSDRAYFQKELSGDGR